MRRSATQRQISCVMVVTRAAATTPTNAQMIDSIPSSFRHAATGSRVLQERGGFSLLTRGAEPSGCWGSIVALSCQLGWGLNLRFNPRARTDTSEAWVIGSGTSRVGILPARPAVQATPVSPRCNVALVPRPVSGHGCAREAPRREASAHPTRGLLAEPRRASGDSPGLPLAPSERGVGALAHGSTGAERANT